MVSARLHVQLRKPGAHGVSARYVEVGGSGGTGRMATAAPGRGTEKSSAVAVLSRSLSVTCLLRRFTGSARALTGSRDAKTAKPGCLR